MLRAVSFGVNKVLNFYETSVVSSVHILSVHSVFVLHICLSYTNCVFCHLTWMTMRKDQRPRGRGRQGGRPRQGRHIPANV